MDNKDDTNDVIIFKDKFKVNKANDFFTADIARAVLKLQEKEDKQKEISSLFSFGANILVVLISLNTIIVFASSNNKLNSPKKKSRKARKNYNNIKDNNFLLIEM